MIGEARVIVKTIDGEIHASKWSSALFARKNEHERSLTVKGLQDIAMPGGTIRKFNPDHIIYTEIETR